MYSEIERKLKTVAWVNIICSLVVSFILLCNIMINSDNYYGYTPSFYEILVLIFLPVIAFIESFFIHGFTELLENIKEINRKLNVENQEELSSSNKQRSLLKKRELAVKELRNLSASATKERQALQQLIQKIDEELAIQ